ncbi:hypothetical protein [Lacticigenium naphthae]|nr:hypothetical protein [Lacticigenium naphthae]
MRKESIVINTPVFDELIKDGKYQVDLLEEIDQTGIGMGNNFYRN